MLIPGIEPAPGRVVLSHDGAALAVGINVTRYRDPENQPRARERAPTTRRAL